MITKATIRPFTPQDLDSVMAIQSGSPGSARWSRSDYEHVFRGGFAGWVAQGESGILGFAVARRMADEIEILNLAVASVVRRSMIGTLLLGEAMRWGKEGGAHRAFLEVRDTNFAAILFYERNGFLGVGRRRHYYSDPEEDALLLACPIITERSMIARSAD
ncbi:MAG: GNAT family N-acetyltransferase [Candidatus Acidiferrales bacterium]